MLKRKLEVDKVKIEVIEKLPPHISCKRDQKFFGAYGSFTIDLSLTFQRLHTPCRRSLLLMRLAWKLLSV